MSKLVIAGGRVIDPANKTDGLFDVVIEAGKIAEVRPTASGSKSGRNGTSADTSVIDARGRIVAPGFIDLHTHLREPGREDKETIDTGLHAAVRGGFTTVCAMPNTEPAIDEPGVVEQVRQAARRAGLADVQVIGAVTIGRQGKELTSFGELFDAGCVGLSDDGSPVSDSLLMRRALEYARIFNRPIIQHAEDLKLVVGGVMHEGAVSTRLGLRGMPSAAESVIVARDLALAELTGGWLHVAHISCAQTVDLVRQAKRRGIRVTCEVTPHHLALTDEAIGDFDTRAKVNPPLRTDADRLALIEALADGTIDAIATDHAPHTDWEKDAEFDAAPFGISGLETALAVCVTELIEAKRLTWPQLIERMSCSPAKIARLPVGTFSVGSQADVVILDPDCRGTVQPHTFCSKGRNTPFAGRELTGAVVATIAQGRTVFQSSHARAEAHR